jgi:hypothetical protein
MNSVFTHFPSFQIRDDGALDVFVCTLCTYSLLNDSKKIWIHSANEVHCVFHYWFVS